MSSTPASAGSVSDHIGADAAHGALPGAQDLQALLQATADSSSSSSSKPAESDAAASLPDFLLSYLSLRQALHSCRERPPSAQASAAMADRLLRRMYRL